MTPQEKAQDLFVTFYERYPDFISNNEAKAEAKFSVGVLINELLSLKMIYHIAHDNELSEGHFYELVREELEKL